jgi:fibronectin type 3 domain-containing protein
MGMGLQIGLALGATIKASAASAPSAPTNLILTPDAAFTKVDGTHDASVGATSYNVYRATDGGARTQILTGQTTSWTDSTVALGHVYVYDVTAVNAGGESSASSTQSVTTPLLKDTFTDSNGTALASHTMDVGSGWTIGSGAVAVQSNKAVFSATGQAVADAGRADCTLSVKFRCTDTNQYGVIPFRYVDESNFWFLYIDAGNRIRIFEKASGSNTTRATTTISYTANNDYTVTVTLLGASIVATFDGGNGGSYGSAATGLSATKHGIGSDFNAGATFDDFQVTP